MHTRLIPLVLVGLVACAGRKEPELALDRSLTIAGDGEAYEEGSEAPVVSWTLTEVGLGETIAAACGVPVPETFFDFDSARLSERARQVMGELATYMNSGRLQGQTVTIIGYTDPRGSDYYNQMLGKSRADSVRDALVASGVPGDRIKILSRGEDGPALADKGWSYDRRVEIRIGDSTVEETASVDMDEE